MNNYKLIASNLIDFAEDLQNEYDYIKSTIMTTIKLIANFDGSDTQELEIRKHLYCVLDSLMYSPLTGVGTRCIYESEARFKAINGEDYSKVDRVDAFKIQEIKESEENLNE